MIVVQACSPFGEDLVPINTQEDLAEKLGTTSKSISRWENGRTMPDVSMFNPLCNELGITINELLSGQKIKNEEYQQKIEENIINLAIKNKKKNKKVIIISLITAIAAFIAWFTAVILYNTIVIDVNYDERLMSCSFVDNKLNYFNNGSSVLNTDYIQRVIDNKKYIIFHSTINIYNQKRSDWEYKESLAKKLNGDKHIFSSFWHFDEETIKCDNIVVYYTILTKN